MYHHLARQVRKYMTDAEKVVWKRLRSKSFNGFRFRRQAAVGEYIADFVCFSHRVVLELDGEQHAVQVEADEQRSAWFRSQGFVVLRYWNHQVAEDWDVIEQELYAALTRDEKTPHPNPPPQGGEGTRTRCGRGAVTMASDRPAKPFAIGWEGAIFLALLMYPLFPVFERGFFSVTSRSLGEQLPLVFIFALLAYGLNVVVGYTGLLHLGIAAFFAVGAYVAGIFTVAAYPFGWSFWVVLPLGTLAAAGLGLMLGAPTLRLRGDYLALVTLGFGEVTKFTLRNVEGITAGTRGLSPIPPPTDHAIWADDYRPFYYLTLGVLIVAALMLRNLERSRLGRAWIALREDELAANCMGLNPNKLKLAAFALGAGLAGLAGVLYATRLTSTADPNAYDFNRSIFMVCCLILGGLGNRLGALVGVILLVGFDNILTPIIDGYIQQAFPNAGGKIYLTFTGWRLALFGLALILMMRFRPEGIIPSSRVKHELHPDEVVSDAVDPITMGRTTGEVANLNGRTGGQA